MSRSGYSYDCETINLWRGTIASATFGKRGQRFFRELVAALDAMPAKRLVADAFEEGDGEVCALGAIGKQKSADVEALARAADNMEYDVLGKAFDIAGPLAQEVMYVNDEAGPYRGETPEQRWERVRKWAASKIRQPAPSLETL